MRLDALFEEFLEELALQHEIPWNDAGYPADDFELTEDLWAELDEVFPEPMI